MSTASRRPVEVAGLLRDAGLDPTGIDATGRVGVNGGDPELRFEAEGSVAEYAETLARLHTLPLTELRATAPSLPVLDADTIVRRVQDSHRQGHLDAGRLSDAYRHMSLDRLVEILGEGRPATRTAGSCLTHGDPEMSRAIYVAGRSVGFVEWDHAAIADPHRDLAVAARSVARDLGPMLVPILVERYCDAAALRGGAADVDPVRFDWYALVAELGDAGAR